MVSCDFILILKTITSLYLLIDCHEIILIWHWSIQMAETYMNLAYSFSFIVVYKLYNKLYVINFILLY